MQENRVYELLRDGDWGEDREMLAAFRASPQYPLLCEAYDRLDHDALYHSRVHGSGHIHRVMLFAGLLAWREGLGDEDTRQLLRAASYHDVGRTFDGYDLDHGARSAERLAELTGQTGEALCELKAAVTAHSRPDAQLEDIVRSFHPADLPHALELAKLLKDADNLDRVRLGDLKPRFLRHESARALVPFAYRLFALDQGKRGGAPVPAIAFARAHAPCYLYEAATIVRQCRALREALPGFRFLYSVKAAPFAPVLRCLAGEGFGADAASAGEVRRAAEAGLGPILWSAPGKTEEDLAACADRCTVVADSLRELERLEALGKARGTVLSVGLRVAPAFTMDGPGGVPTKFGVAEEQLPELPTLLARCPHLRVVGLHVHVRSQVLDAQRLGAYWRRCFDLARRMAALDGVTIEWIDFGSGLGVPYGGVDALDLAELGRLAAPIAAENAATLRATLYVETGRFVMSAAGLYFTPVVDIKVTRGRKYLIVAGGMSGFLRPAVAALLARVTGGEAPGGLEPLCSGPGAHRLLLFGGGERTERVTVVGGLCTELDVLAEDVELDEAAVGDLIAVTDAGSYAYSLSPLHFADQEPPRQYLRLEDGSFVDR